MSLSPLPSPSSLPRPCRDLDKPRARDLARDCRFLSPDRPATVSSLPGMIDDPRAICIGYEPRELQNGDTRMDGYASLWTRAFVAQHASGASGINRTLRGKPLPALFKPSRCCPPPPPPPLQSLLFNRLRVTLTEVFIFSSPDNNPPIVTWTERGRG